MALKINGDAVRSRRENLPDAPTQRVFADRIGISYVTLNKIEKGKSGASRDMIEKLAKGLHCKPADILGSKENSGAGVFEVRDNEASTGYRFVEIPHLGVVSASRFMFSFDQPPDHFTTLAIKGAAGERHAMLRISEINGDCFLPTIEPGDEVLIRQTSTVADGSIAIVCFDGECTMKRVYRTKDGIELRADNPAYKPVRYKSNKVRILAEVVKIIKDPRRKP